MADAADLEVVVAVLTFRRPQDIAAVLPRLTEQIDDAGRRGHVLVIDNDPEASARALVEAWSDRRVRYAHEPHPGIAAARNRALDETDADLLVFIDDDERPSPGWLGRLIGVWEQSHPAGVVGPVISEYAHEPEPWIAAGRFFERRRLPTGTLVEVAATNNLLLDLHQLDGLRFDNEFGLSGGSDTLFTRQIVAAGGRLVWCDEAWVIDVVPPTRLTRHWVMQRAFRSGNGWSRTSLVLSQGRRQDLACRVGLLRAGLVRLLGGAVLSVLGVLTVSMARRARGARTLARGAGMVTGAFGYVYSEYARREKSPAP